MYTQLFFTRKYDFQCRSLKHLFLCVRMLESDANMTAMTRLYRQPDQQAGARDSVRRVM